MQQGSAEWTKWRSEGLGSSDAADIMGCGYRTPYKLWKIKTGQITEEPQNRFILDRGHEVEAKVRARLELTSDGDYPPATLESKKWPFLRASLDGFNGKEIIEIKYVGAKYHEPGIPEKHRWQMVHQCVVAEAESVLYIKADLSGVYWPQVYAPTDEEIERYLFHAFEMRWCIENKVWPHSIPEAKKCKTTTPG